MVCKVNCAVITGIEVYPVMIETDVSNGLPSFDMVGLLASDIKESRERVRTAIKNSGFMLPPKRITINFSPANRNIKSENKNVITSENQYDFCKVFGQAQARKAAEISTAGMHNFLMIGSPGTGKSIIAKAMPSDFA